MEPDKKIREVKSDLFVQYNDEINRAYERAVREALWRHKIAGNPVAVSRNGKVFLLQPDEIEIEEPAG